MKKTIEIEVTVCDVEGCGAEVSSKGCITCGRDVCEHCRYTQGRTLDDSVEVVWSMRVYVDNGCLKPRGQNGALLEGYLNLADKRNELLAQERIYFGFEDAAKRASDDLQEMPEYETWSNE
jgi:hypothetical protein